MRKYIDSIEKLKKKKEEIEGIEQKKLAGIAKSRFYDGRRGQSRPF